MKRLLAILAALLLVQIAWAQEAADENTTDDNAPKVTHNYKTYVASGFGFKVDLPDSGTISSPADSDWDKEEQVAFQWIGGENDPVRMIQGRVDTFGKELDQDSFEMFCSALLQNWSSDEKSFTITTANEQLTFGGHDWNLIEVTDRTSAGQPAGEGEGSEGRTVYYSVFTTYAGENIYTITLYYLQPVNDDVEALGVPILKTFATT